MIQTFNPQMPRRAVMEVMAWSSISMTKRYQHVPNEFQRDIADSVGRLLWEPPDEDDDPGGASVPVPA